MSGRCAANLTLNLGVRYEYVSPLTEVNNHIANLDLSPGVLNPLLPLGVNPVTPIQSGYSGLPASLVRPDRNNFAPRLGFAWKPLSEHGGARRVWHQLQHGRVSGHRAATGDAASVRYDGDERSSSVPDCPQPDVAERLSSGQRNHQ